MKVFLSYLVTWAVGIGCGGCAGCCKTGFGALLG